MRTLVVYASRQGCSEKSAELIRRLLGEGCDTLNLERDNVVSLEAYDTVIIGGPIYYGRPHGSVEEFCRANLALLLQRRIGLYICCMQTGETAMQELHNAFPPELLSHASASGIFGGEIHMERINFVERFIVRSVIKTEYNVSTFSEERVRLFLRRLFAA